VIDALHGAPALVRLPEGHVTIDDLSGSSILASTSAATIVSTATLATRTLSVHETALRAVAPGHWWILRDDGTMRSDTGNAVARVPAGLRVVAAVLRGFVGLDAASGWVGWTGLSVEPLPWAGGQLVAATPEAAVVRSDCSFAGCLLALARVYEGTSVSTRFPAVPLFASYSPDGTRLAIASSVGDVFVLDASSGRILGRTLGRQSASPSVPFSWTPNGDSLLVVQDEDVEIRNASDGALRRVVAGTAGLEQLFALP